MIDSTVANSTENVSPNIIYIAWLMLTSKLTRVTQRVLKLACVM